MQGTGNIRDCSSGTEFHLRYRNIGLEGRMNCAYIPPDRCQSNQFLKTRWRLHQCPGQPVPVLSYPSHWKVLFIPMGAWAGCLIYLPSHINAEWHVATLLGTCSVLMTVLHLGQGGNGEKHASIKLGVQIQMAEIYFLPRLITKKTEK